MSFPERLKSRKLLMTIFGFATMFVTQIFRIPHEVVDTIMKAVEILVPTYVGSQGIVDGTLNIVRAVQASAKPKKRISKK